MISEFYSNYYDAMKVKSAWHGPSEIVFEPKSGYYELRRFFW